MSDLSEITKTYATQIPLRPGVMIQVSGIPVDLTRKEVERIRQFLVTLILPVDGTDDKETEICIEEIK